MIRWPRIISAAEQPGANSSCSKYQFLRVSVLISVAQNMTHDAYKTITITPFFVIVTRIVSFYWIVAGICASNDKRFLAVVNRGKKSLFVASPQNVVRMATKRIVSNCARQSKSNNFQLNQISFTKWNECNSSFHSIAPANLSNLLTLLPRCSLPFHTNISHFSFEIYPICYILIGTILWRIFALFSP